MLNSRKAFVVFGIACFALSPAQAGWLDIFTGKGDTKLTPPPAPEEEKSGENAPVAAVRGLGETDETGKPVKKDYEGVSKVEKTKVAPEKVEKFKKEGQLKSQPKKKK